MDGLMKLLGAEALTSPVAPPGPVLHYFRILGRLAVVSQHSCHAQLESGTFSSRGRSGSRDQAVRKTESALRRTVLALQLGRLSLKIEGTCRAQHTSGRESITTRSNTEVPPPFPGLSPSILFILYEELGSSSYLLPAAPCVTLLPSASSPLTLLCSQLQSPPCSLKVFF